MSSDCAEVSPTTRQTVDTLTLFLSLSDKANARKTLPEREFVGSVLIGARGLPRQYAQMAGADPEPA